jgi:cysteine synthase A
VRAATIVVVATAPNLPTNAAIAQKLPDLALGSRVLGFNYDTGERYLSVEGFLPVE